MPVKMSRQSTPANSLYYDARTSQAGTGSPPVSPVLDVGNQCYDADDSSLAVTRGNPLTTAQSPIQQNEFQHHRSIIRERDDSYAIPQSNLNKHPSQEGSGAEIIAPGSYDESRGGVQTSGGDEGFGRSGSQKSVKNTKFAVPNVNPNGTPGPNKLHKSQSMRSRNGSFSRISHRPAYDTVHGAPNANIGDAGGALAMGTVMSAPDAEAHDELEAGFNERAAAAEGTLTRKQSARIKKNEHTLGNRISKIIQSEGKTEQQALDSAIKELAEIQKMQQVAVKEETRTRMSHTKALHNLHNRELAVIKAQSDLEKADADMQARLAKVQAELNKSKAKAQAQLDKAQAEVDKARAEVKAHDDHKEASRRHAMETTDWVKNKRKEVEVLRGWMGVDNREREAKINELKA